MSLSLSMSGRGISKIIALGAIALTALIIVQAIWLNRSLDSRKRQFAQNVQSALRASTEALLDNSAGMRSGLQPIDQLSSNYFVVNINAPIQPESLKSILLREFSLRNIEQNFEFSIYDCANENIIFGKYIENKEQDLAQAKFPQIEKDNYYFSVLFPSISFQLISEMGIWLVSAVISILLILIFSYTVFMLFRQKQLRELQTDFINNMTHEFKTPLSSIALCAEIMLQKEKEQQPHAIGQYATMISKEVGKLDAHIKQLLQSSSVENPKLPLTITEFDICDLLKTCVNELQLKFQDDQAGVQLDCPDEAIILNQDQFHVRNMINNLLDNALKYGGNPPKINIKIAEQGQCVALQIADNGQGIEADEIKHIFDRFYRIPTGELHNVSGFGLGLYYVKTLCTVLKGTIDVKDSETGGALFELKLPIHA